MPEITDEKISDVRVRRIRLALEYAGINMSQLSEACDVSRAAVSLWLHKNPERRSNPSSDNLACIAKTTGVSLGWLNGRPGFEGPPDIRATEIHVRASSKASAKGNVRRSNVTKATLIRRFVDIIEQGIDEHNVAVRDSELDNGIFRAEERFELKKILDGIANSFHVGKNEYPMAFLNNQFSIDVLPIATRMHLKVTDFDKDPIDTDNVDTSQFDLLIKEKIFTAQTRGTATSNVREAAWRLAMAERVSWQAHASRQMYLFVVPDTTNCDLTRKALELGINPQSFDVIPPHQRDVVVQYAKHRDYKGFTSYMLSRTNKFKRLTEECRLMNIQLNVVDNEFVLLEEISNLVNGETFKAAESSP